MQDSDLTLSPIHNELTAIHVNVRIGFGFDSSSAALLSDLARGHADAVFIGGSTEQGEHFYRLPFSSLASFRQDIRHAGFVAQVL